MEPRIVTIPPKKMVGRKQRMSLTANRTVELWQFLMPRQKEIRNKLNSDLFSVQIFDQDFDFKYFTPETEFEKWAAVEVSDYLKIQDGMETLNVPEGLYAVFDYKGAANNFAPMFHYIFGTWIPASGYEVDKRPHFDVLGEKYKGNDPTSEEEIWVPLKMKK
ncbi:MAG: GyrI-like domain-containing protein [Prolixibacteraceae bacterium]|jgi:AraC family transcriptional regulator